VLVVAALAGLLVARQSGERLPGQGMTGGSSDGSVSSLLVQARSVGMADTPKALDLYSQVLAIEPDNVEALTYFGWFTVLSATSDQTSEDAVVRERFQSGLLLIRQATVSDPTYPDAHCFLGISFYRFLQDAEAAQPEVQACLDSNPPAEVKSLVEGLAASIDAELAGS
jgi:cytochrome c-type biogenesis protein CcmH/NrfG